LVPDGSPKWVWNSMSTRFNSKGMELETVNALQIYTAAQYGYHKTLPVAIANNSRAKEMFYEGFEDYDYDDLLNNSQYNRCNVKHIDFSGLDHSQIFTPTETGLYPHTGKSMLLLYNGQTQTKNFQVNAENGYDIPLE